LISQSRGLGDVYKRQFQVYVKVKNKIMLISKYIVKNKIMLISKYIVKNLFKQ
jgi:hypothetical protein